MVDTTFLTSTTNLIDPTTLSPALASPANDCLIEVQPPLAGSPILTNYFINTGNQVFAAYSSGISFCTGYCDSYEYIILNRTADSDTLILT